MTDGGEELLEESLEKAIEKTKGSLPKSAGPVCSGHEVIESSIQDVREGVHVLCLCKKAEMESGATKSKPAKLSTRASFFGGLFRFDGYDGATLSRLVAIVLLGYIALALAGVRVPRFAQAEPPVITKGG